MNALARVHPALETGVVKASLAPSQMATVDRAGSVALVAMHRACPTLWTPVEADLFATLLSTVASDAGVDAIVLHGADIFREADEGGVADARLVIESVARCRVPVVAAVEGEAVGAGLELALACAARVAGPTSSWRMPALAQGRLPTHGAIERLPRLIGMAAAAELLILRGAFSAGEALDTGLVDAVGDNVLTVALELARERHANLKDRTREDAPLDPDCIADLFGVRREIRRRAVAQGVLLMACEALENAARLPLRRAFAETERLADKLSRLDEAVALAHAASARRALADWGGPARREALARCLRWPLLREAVHLLDEGATPAQIDRVLTAYGLADGPFIQSDREGLLATFFSGPDGSTEAWQSYSPTLDLMLDAGREGGASPGWYKPCDEDPDRRVFDPEIGRLLEASATFQRLCRSPIADEAVESRCLLAAINGAAGVVETSDEGVTTTIVDAVWVEHLGFPAWKGGPMHQAGRAGFGRVVADIEALHARRNTLGEPAALLRRALQA